MSARKALTNTVCAAFLAGAAWIGAKATKDHGLHLFEESTSIVAAGYALHQSLKVRRALPDEPREPKWGSRPLDDRLVLK